MRNKIALIIGVLILAGAGYLVYANQNKNNTNETVDPEVVETGLSAADEAVLKAAVEQKIDQETKGVWDKKFTINKVDPTQKGVVGTWWARDAWDWFAWKPDTGTWNVLVNLDGWDCEEWDSVPRELMDFMAKNTYQPPAAYHGRYCFDHSEIK